MADDAYAFLADRLQEWRLESLAGDLQRFIEQGYSAARAELELQETTAWKQRFAGNEERRKRGLPLLSPAEYLSVENAYREVMRSFGVPEGFYDDPSDFAQGIGEGKSPSELQETLALGQRVFTQGEMTGVVDYMRSRFGLSDGDTLAWFIDPDRALPLLAKQVQAAEIGAAARATRFGELSADTALRLAERGVSEEQAIGTFAELAELEALTKRLPGQAGQTVTGEQLVAAGFEGDVEAQRAIHRAQVGRSAEFGGGGGFVTSREGVTGLGPAS